MVMRRERSVPAITEAESAVMEVLWRRSPLPTEAVVAELEGEKRWREGTIKFHKELLIEKLYDLRGGVLPRRGMKDGRTPRYGARK